MSDWQPTTLAPEHEAAFQRDMQFAPGYRDWRVGFQRQYGEAPNFNDPASNYDYRGAWQAGLAPAPYEHDGGRYHWQSQTPDGKMLKAPDHPTAWMQHFMTQYGVDPNVAPNAMLVDGLQRGIVPTPDAQAYANALRGAP